MSWEENVRKVVPYVAGEQPKDTDVIKLNTNECPYPPAPGVEKRAKELCVDRLRLYPNMDAAELVAAIADYYNVKESEVFVGVGSDDVLGMAFMTFFNSDKPILFPDITYSFYDVWAELFRIPYETCALDEAFRIRKEDYFRPNGGIIIPNPNAPTAIFEDCSVLEEIVAGNPGSVVIIDEAYVDFGAESMLPLIHKYDNLMVVQTFSKSRAMAGMRMPARYVAEMVCDRIAASKIYQGDRYTDAHPLAYFQKGKADRMIHPETSEFLEFLLQMLADQGETAVFQYLRKALREGCPYEQNTKLPH